MREHYDWIIIGSGFGGSVSALRLVEKGYRVLVIEKGRRFTKSDFPKTNWDLRNWMWAPRVGLRGIFQMSFMRHVTILHGVGVGGGSLTYANTLPRPKDEFFKATSWGHLADWASELSPHYDMAEHMLGATETPCVTPGDRVLREIAREMGREEHHHPTRVAVYFGEPGQEVADPYFGGKGPRRVGCTLCGACMTGCRVGAKNTLDQNYLYLAEQGGLDLVAETEVMAVRARSDGGYALECRQSFGRRRRANVSADRVIFSGGVMGSIPLLLKMKDDPRGLPRLSPRLGDFVRTNSEALIGVAATPGDEDFSTGVAITSILHTDDHSHVEPVRYGKGSSFFRLMAMPHAPGDTVRERLTIAAREYLSKPKTYLKMYTAPKYAEGSQILLYMRTLEGSLKFRLNRGGPLSGFQPTLQSVCDDPAGAPAAFMPEATAIAERFAEKVGGVPAGLMTETLMGVPSTAHILGGACMGTDADTGVIDTDHQAFGHEGLYVIDGAAVSANPGVNPSLTITALAERAMSRIPAKGATVTR